MVILTQGCDSLGAMLSNGIGGTVVSVYDVKDVIHWASDGRNWQSTSLLILPNKPHSSILAVLVKGRMLYIHSLYLCF